MVVRNDFSCHGKVFLSIVLIIWHLYLYMQFLTLLLFVIVNYSFNDGIGSTNFDPIVARNAQVLK